MPPPHQLIDKGRLEWKQAIDHLLEMAEADSVPETASGSLLTLSIKKNRVHIGDFCNPLLYQKVCSTEIVKYLEGSKGFCPTLLPNQECINAAVEKSHEFILEYIKDERERNTPPSKQ